ncbi:hypothetical protein [Vibrio mangrovi]|uniref:Uncharacterized protein n=1 Tax=Vibrio mangrovi TaxID=474394 RepID=A0A1Y6IU12_9VIBR|nr:hypothetical protein [Vibrio mangrovi]MDW6004842.1 hypothetical protein [Vibrio mangrovi]SMS01134.1 hypothetical protein VIM7927_02411 [Vibrio mangrovi]
MSSILSSQVTATVPQAKIGASVITAVKELAGIFAMFAVTSVITFFLALSWVNF